MARELSTIHALHIDGNYVYLYGSKLFNGGAVVADLTDPWNPKYVGKYENSTSAYIHDGYVRNDTLYGSHIYDGFYSIVDFTNKANPVELASQFTPTKFTHNTWLSTDSKTLFTTDENSSSFLTSYDITNPANISELDRIQSNPGSGSIVHNTHIIQVNGNDYAVTSWYKDGFTIVDAGRPQNLVQVGNYDTYTAGAGSGFEGDWGVYPYLPSGTIVVSNIDEGLFVFTPTYVRACYLEGNVTDSITNAPINGATIEILTTNFTKSSKLTGDYATGYLTPGTYSVKYSKAGYKTKIISGINLAAGQLTIQNVQLAPLVSFSYNIHVQEVGTGTPISGANVWLMNSDFSFTATTNANGDAALPAIFADTYELIVGHWGHITSCTQNNSIASTGVTTVQLMPGYYDDFVFDFGWVRTGSAPKGRWERVVPIGTTDGGKPANAGYDDTTDCSTYAYVTQNGGTGAGQNDVDNGSTIITSPVFDLTGYTNPSINYSRWFYVGGGGNNAPNDSITIFLKDATHNVLMDFAYDSITGMSAWFQKSFLISNFMPPSSTMQLIVVVRDRNPGHIVEGGFDKFYITGAPVGIDEQISKAGTLKAYPNPFNTDISISYDVLDNKKSAIQIVDVTGRVVELIPLTQNKGNILLTPEINAGIYFIRIVSENKSSEFLKIVKMK